MLLKKVKVNGRHLLYCLKKVIAFVFVLRTKNLMMLLVNFNTLYLLLMIYCLILVKQNSFLKLTWKMVIGRLKLNMKIDIKPLLLINLVVFNGYACHRGYATLQLLFNLLSTPYFTTLLENFCIVTSMIFWFLVQPSRITFNIYLWFLSDCNKLI